jgi:hypothetical protein
VNVKIRLASCDFDQAPLFGDVGLERLAPIENALEVHPAVDPEKGLPERLHLLPKSAAGCSSL